MARWKRIEERLKRFSKDISFEEITVLLEHYGYRLNNKGHSSGSRVVFSKPKKPDITMHNPHPQKELQEYVVRYLHEFLESEGFWDE